MNRRIISGWFLTTLVLCLCIGSAPGLISSACAEMISRPGVYSGYSAVLYDGDVRFSQYVTVRDGTKLAVDVYRPTLNGQLVTTPLPVVWMHSPYNRRYYPAPPTLAVDLYPGAARGLIKYGYVVAVVDSRGLYASFGSAIGYNRGEWMPHAFWDAYDITEWFAAQPWSSGKIGMWGCSATGETQVQAVASNPPHLKAVFPMSCAADFWGTGSGVVSNANAGTPAPAIPYWSAPSFNATAEPVDADTDKSMLATAKLQQQKGSDIGYSPYRDSISPRILQTLGLTVRWNLESGPQTYFRQISRAGIPMYNTGNWQDAGALRWGPLLRLKNLHNPAKVLLGPGGHCIWYTDYSPKPYPITFRIVNEEHRWFDYWLKGIQNGVMDEPPIYLFTYNKEASKEWKFAWQWPLPDEKRISLYLGPSPSSGASSGVNNGTLSLVPPSKDQADAKDDYPVDYSATAANRNSKGLTYTTDVLPSDIEVTGDPVVELWASSTAADGDFFAYLEDVNPDGTTSFFAVDGNLRASNRALHHPPYDTWGLPWHRSFAEDAKPLESGKPVKLAFNMGTASYVFKAGRRIRLIITCASTATPILSPAPTVTIYRNPVLKSRLILSVGGSPVKAEVKIEPDRVNPKTKGIFKAFVKFPKNLAKGYVEDVNYAGVTLNGFPALSGTLHGDIWIFKFNIEHFSGLKKVDKAKMLLEGSFGRKYDYGGLSFEGSDTIRIHK